MAAASAKSPAKNARTMTMNGKARGSFMFFWGAYSRSGTSGFGWLELKRDPFPGGRPAWPFHIGKIPAPMAEWKKFAAVPGAFEAGGSAGNMRTQKNCREEKFINVGGRCDHRYWERSQLSSKKFHEMCFLAVTPGSMLFFCRKGTGHFSGLDGSAPGPGRCSCAR